MELRFPNTFWKTKRRSVFPLSLVSCEPIVSIKHWLIWGLVSCWILLLFWMFCVEKFSYVLESSVTLIYFSQAAAADGSISVANSKSDLVNEDAKSKRTVLDLLKTPNMRKRSFNLFYCWWVLKLLWTYDEASRLMLEVVHRVVCSVSVTHRLLLDSQYVSW